MTSVLLLAVLLRPLPQREIVAVPNGDLTLRAVLWVPAGSGPFPAVLYNHGGGRGHNSATFARDQEFYTREPDVLGPVFARHGYAFLYLYRRGAGLSADQGTYSGDLLDEELARNGAGAMNRLQVRLLETDQMSDALAGLALLRSRRQIDASRIAVVGHSFGGSLTLLVAERDSSLRAVVDLAGAAASWPRSPQLASRLREAVRHIAAPVLFIHAANDYSTEPGIALAAERKQAGKPYRLQIYPAVGTTSYEGHNFIDSHVSMWEADVFAFLDEQMKSRAR